MRINIDKFGSTHFSNKKHKRKGPCRNETTMDQLEVKGLTITSIKLFPIKTSVLSKPK